MTTRIASTNIQSNTILTTNLAQSTIDALQGSTVPTITQIQITTSGYVVKDDTAVSTSGGYIKITGTNFTAGSQVVIGSTPATSVGFVNSTTLNVQVPALAAGTYVVYVTINTGSVAIIVNGLTYSGDPTWVTGSTLTGGQIDSAISIQLSATGDAPVTYALQAGSSLPAGLTLTSGGLLSGTVTGITVETTYNFTIEAIDAQAQESPRAFSITISASDANFEYVTTLLSANNPASTFITDASTNNFAVSVFGDTRPNNFGPYTPGYYSNFFDGTGDYLTTPTSDVFTFGSGDLTVECWIYQTDTSVNSYRVIVADNTYSNPTGWTLYSYNNQLNLWKSGAEVIAPAGTITLNTWTHVAWTRSGSSNRLFINGVQVGATTSDSTDYTSNAIYVGASRLGTLAWPGFLSNVRIVKGTAVYTSNFTPSTTPLTAIANTSLLTCQSNRFIDNSIYNFAITRNGDTLISGFDPFAPLSAYSTYGSGYFDGTGDYLSLAGNTAFTMPGDFTAEAWVYCNGYTNDYAAIFGFSSDSENTGWNILVRTNGRLHFNVAMTFTDATGTLPLNQWTHVALVRSGSGSGNVKLYVNGVADATTLTVTATATSPSTVMLGSYPGITSRAFNGYIMDARIVKGTAVYTSNFTPPTTPLTAIANTSLLTLQNNQPNNNNMFLDSSSSNFLITRNGNTTQGSFSPYGGGWSSYSGSVSNCVGIYLNGQTDFAFGTGDFTIEMWVNLTAKTDGQVIYDSRPGSQGVYPTVYVDGSANKLKFYVSSADRITQTSTFTYNVWHHVVVTRTGTSTKMFVDGVQEGSTYTDTNNYLNGADRPFTGDGVTPTSASFGVSGYISNLRVVKGSGPYQSAGSTITVPSSPLAPIANTVLLTLQSNRFIDASASNKTINLYNSPTIQRYNPFNPVLTTPTSYSGYFDGTGDYLTAPNNAATTLNADFTIEFWVYRPVSGNNYFFCLGDTITSSGIEVYIGSTGSALIVYSNGANRISSATLPAVGTWSHVAVVRAGTTVTLYLNGASLGTWTSSATFSGTTYIGAEFFNGSVTGVCTGYISNVRLVKGTAVYTAAFTPPTAPLTAVSGTSLLTLQNATFIDNSTNNFAITVFGNSQPIQFNPFGWTSSTGGNATYSATNYGGSMYFDGTGDYLALPSNSAFAFGTGDFTIEMWAYFASVANFPTLTDSRASTSSTAGFNLGLSSAKVQLYTTSQLLIGATTLTANNWNHIAVTRSGTTLRIFLNGVQDASATNSTNWSDTTLRIGATPDTVNFMTGYIGNLRLVKGQALYTSNFAPPVAPLSFNANTVLQVNGTSAAIYDSAMITTYETVADARSTGVIKKYGNSSLLFDGTGDALYAPWVPSLELGAGSFTIEFWAYIVGGNALYCWSADYHYAMTFNYGGANANRVGIWASSNGSSWNIFNADGGGNGISTGTITTNTWTHVALVRNGSTWTLYLNGTSAWTGTSSATIVTRSTDTFRIGGPWPVAGPTIFNGYMDDFRITPGVARYTTTFTPPTNPVIQF